MPFVSGDLVLLTVAELCVPVLDHMGYFLAPTPQPLSKRIDTDA